MSSLHFDFDWVSPEGARGAELRATWARFRLEADGAAITRVEDLTAKSVRDSIYGPLYPLAEWIAMNWWAIFHEARSPFRGSAFIRRHDISFATEGFALPALTISVEGSHTLLQWRRNPLPSCRVDFIDEGTARVPTQEFQDTLRSFVQAVVTRLEDQNVENTLLALDWKAITSADKEERDFCEAAGRLGLDPYDVDETTADRIIHLSAKLPPNIIDELYSVADVSQLLFQGQEVEVFLRNARNRDVSLPALKDLRKKTTRLSREILRKGLPWDQGYVFADQLRKLLGKGMSEPIPSLEALGAFFSLDVEPWTHAIASANGMSGFVNAAVAPTRDDSPFFAVTPRSETSKVFMTCRALFDYLTTPDSSAALVTEASSERQKRNRAFAAEFLAPAEALRSRIKTEFVTEQDMQELAAEFHTSDMVIRHQIQNHNLARIWGSIA